LSNPFLDESHQGGAESLPFPDNTFDLVFHNYRAEHFPTPLACNREIARVLRPGGQLLFQTPNRYDHASLFASMTPQWFHEFYVRVSGQAALVRKFF
jgi:ubiquinone/menaquinone biosynthesis C-methylase UbiE